MAKPQAAQPASFGDDRARIIRIRHGDANAFDGLVVEYGAGLCDFVDGFVQSRAMAEEIVQDLFCRMWDHRQTLSVTTTIAGYLYRAARNRALNAVRDRRVELEFLQRVRSADSADGPAAALRRPEAADQRLYANELAEHAERAIASLPERCRQVFVLHRSHDLTYAEIAEVMNLSAKTVEAHMGRALGELRRHLAPWLAPAAGGTPSSGRRGR